MQNKKNVEAFNQDVGRLGGYEYTRQDRLSSTMGNRRISAAIHESINFTEKTILDLGCGDGTYTAEFASFEPRMVTGIDAAEVAISSARRRMADDPRFRFSVGSAYDLTPYYGKFDVAVIRGVLHHLQDPARAVAETCKTASIVVVLEPNGYNPVLKIIEKVSPYHRVHEEQSFPPSTLRKWAKECGGNVVREQYIGLVPMFCPDWMAKLLKKFEPLVEKTPMLRQIGCGQYIYTIRTRQVRYAQ